MARHADAGDEVHVLLVGEGATSRLKADATADRGKSTQGSDIVSAAAEAAGQAAEVVGANPPVFLGMPDNRLDSIVLLDLVQAIEQVITQVQPQIVYTHHGGDLNVDHRLVHQAVLTACRPLPGSDIASIYAFEVLSSTEWGADQANSAFCPNHFVNVSEWMEKKVAALGCYAMEMRDFPHPRSIKAVQALAELRGATVGWMAAEAFQVVRQRVR